MRLERFQVDDLLFIKPRPPQVYPGYVNALQSERGMGLTAWEGNTALGAAGITRWPQIDEGWAYVSADLNIFTFHRLVKQFIRPMIRWMRVRKMYVRVEPGFPDTWARWPRMLGLTCIGKNGDGVIFYEGLF